MSRPMIRLHNTETNEIIDREMNDAEYADFLKLVEEQEKQAAERDEAENKRQSALAKLEALGLDEDDLKALGL